MKCLITALTLLIAYSAASQCGFETNEVDEFTGERELTTYSRKVLFDWDENVRIRFHADDDGLFVVIDYVLSAYSNFKPYTISQGQELIMLLEDGSKVVGAAKQDFEGAMKTVFGLPPSYMCTISPILYHISKEDLQKLSASKINKMRVYKTDGTGHVSEKDITMKPSPKWDAWKLAECFEDEYSSWDR